jgi:uncharacterized Zn-finger protein
VFSQSSTLQRHIGTHTGDKLLKDFECGICGKGFKENVNLQEHIKIHTDDDTLYKCDICDCHLYVFQYVPVS